MSEPDQEILHGNLGVSTDTLFLINGNVPGQISVRGKDSDTDLRLSEAEGQFPLITVVGRFVDDRPAPGQLRHFIVNQFAPHAAIAERAFAIFTSGTGGSAEDDWFRAERELLQL